MKRRVLVTTVINTDTGIQSDIYGRYDAVSLAAKHEKIVRSKFCMYELSDADFVKHGRYLYDVETK